MLRGVGRGVTLYREGVARGTVRVRDSAHTDAGLGGSASTLRTRAVVVA
jgi:hypothetical protein